MAAPGYSGPYVRRMADGCLRSASSTWTGLTSGGFHERSRGEPNTSCHRGRHWNGGGYALRCALDHPSVGVATVIGRKKLDISHPKLRQVLHRDFADCSAL